jgi:hypothetical protein
MRIFSWGCPYSLRLFDVGLARSQVTVLFSRWAGDRFECGVEGEEEFSHDRCESQFVRFAFDA